MKNLTRAGIRRIIKEELSRLLVEAYGENLPRDASKKFTIKVRRAVEAAQKKDPGLRGRLQLNFDVVDRSVGEEGMIHSKMSDVVIDDSTHREMREIGEMFVERPFFWRATEPEQPPVPAGKYTYTLSVSG